MEKILKIEEFELLKEENKLYFNGEMRFSSNVPLLNIRNCIHKAYISGNVILDFSNLTACNSTNIQNLNKIFIQLCELNKKNKITILGNYNITWQKKGLNNFPLIWPEIEIRFVDGI